MWHHLNFITSSLHLQRHWMQIRSCSQASCLGLELTFWRATNQPQLRAWLGMGWRLVRIFQAYWLFDASDIVFFVSGHHHLHHYPLSVLQALGQSVQLLSCVWLLVTPWTAASQASLSITNSWSPPKLMSIESVMPSSHLILCCPLLLLPSIFPSIRVFSNESVGIRWPKYWSFSISPSNEHPGLISLGWTGWISLQSKGLSRVFCNTTVQKHQFFGTQLSSQSNSHIHTWLLEKP